jgi:hypothetical protein
MRPIRPTASGVRAATVILVRNYSRSSLLTLPQEISFSAQVLSQPLILRRARHATANLASWVKALVAAHFAQP